MPYRLGAQEQQDFETIVKRVILEDESPGVWNFAYKSGWHAFVICDWTASNPSFLRSKIL